MADEGKSPVKLSHRMSTQDASFIYGESHSGPLHIGSLNIFESPIDYDEILDHMARRMHLLPRYRQRLAFAPFNLAHATFEDDPDFDLRNHIKPHSLPDGADERTFLAAAMAAFEPMLDRNKPLWEMHLFQGLPRGRSAVVWKVHHCLVDGVSGMELLTVALDFRAEAPPPEQPALPWRPQPLPSALRRFATALVDLAQNRLNEARQLAGMIDAPREALKRAATIANYAAKLTAMLGRRIVAAPWNAGLVSPARSLAWLKVSFADLRSIRNALGGTANDVVLAILSEAAARYLAEHGVRTDHAPLRIGCPVNVRRGAESGALGNRVSMMFPEFASEPMDAIERLQAVIRETNRIKSAGDAQALELMMELGDLVAPMLLGMGSLVGTNAVDAASKLAALAPRVARVAPLPPPGINFIATNVPGAQVPLYLAGREMVEMVGLVPLGANLGYNVAIVSYNQTLVFGMMAEPRLMPDVDRMRDLAGDVFNELMAAAKAQAGGATARSSQPRAA
ncbi:wax ester/triacylglycerol synthase family O-acyltransferase [bacterium]|nr:wax ester/triacylglycerol synthase family O-acyltransferase [bacterium]